jgi:hypothetical protein
MWLNYPANMFMHHTNMTKKWIDEAEVIDKFEPKE